VDITSGREADTGPGEPAEPPDPVSWKVTLWFVSTFVIGAYLTQVLVVGALYVAERFLP
jgi:hypothetical protein